MKKSERQIEVLLESLVEVVNIEKVIDSLPRGYISVKVISGHTYYYRQWREGNKIISSYVPESYLNVIKQKIEIRKQNEQLLKIVKKDYKKAERAVIKNNDLTLEEIDNLKTRIENSDINEDNRFQKIQEIMAEIIK